MLDYFCVCLWGYECAFLVGILLGVELLGYIVSLCSVLSRSAQLFSSSHPHQRCVRAELLFVLRPSIVRFSVLAILISMYFYFIVALFYSKW